MKFIDTIRSKLHAKFDNEIARNAFVKETLGSLPDDLVLLDAGCGSQQYRQFCDHLQYRSQDFGQYHADWTKGFTSGLGGSDGYKYGSLDYKSDIWNIPVADGAFDAVLCTEVFEHIPFPNETISEFARIMRPGARLILTVPSNCLRHMDPFFFYSGFSNRYLEKMLSDRGFDIDLLEPVGDYYTWISVELARTMKLNSIFAWIILGPALLYYLSKKKTSVSINTLCMGYHVIATRRSSQAA